MTPRLAAPREMSLAVLPALFHRLCAPVRQALAEPPHPSRLPKRVEAAIVGAGVIGLSIGWRLAARGLAVAVLDAGPAGGGTSAAATGMLAAAAEHEPGGRRIAGSRAGKPGALARIQASSRDTKPPNDRLSRRWHPRARRRARRGRAPAGPLRLAAPGRPRDSLDDRTGGSRQGARRAACRQCRDPVPGRSPDRSGRRAAGLACRLPRRRRVPRGKPHGRRAGAQRRTRDRTRGRRPTPAGPARRFWRPGPRSAPRPGFPPNSTCRCGL